MYLVSNDGSQSSQIELITDAMNLSTRLEYCWQSSSPLRLGILGLGILHHRFDPLLHVDCRFSTEVKVIAGGD
jgi:hypothetical protein